MNSAPSFAKRETQGAAGDILNSKAISLAAALKVNAPSPKQKKIRRFLREAAQHIHASRYREAGATALKALDIDETSALGNHIAAIAMDKLGDVELALKLYQRALDFDPSDPEVYQNLGLLAWRIDQLDLAERFFRLQMQIDPSSADAINNLGCVLRDKGQHEDSVEVLRSAIYAHPEHALLWTSLGVTMMEQMRVDEALQFHSEAVRLQPSDARPHHNIGFALTVAGRCEEALSHLETARSLGGLTAEEAAISEHSRAMSLVATGQLEEGWQSYEVRFDPFYTAATKFSLAAPEWTGDSLNGRKLLLMGEQGLGDEILFMSVYRDVLNKVLGKGGKLAIACTDRLVPLFTRSFPEAEIIPHATVMKDGRHWRGAPAINGGENYDCWARMGSMLKLVRNQHTDFAQPDNGFLVPDPDRVAHWRDVLDQLGGGPKIGAVWKSKLMTASRNKYFSAFDQWKTSMQAAQNAGATWINLQYGDCQDELDRARDKWGVDIVTLPGIDLMNDLDEIAALTQALDLMVGPMNASTNISGAVGGKTWIITPPSAWTLLGKQDMLWYPNTRSFIPPAMTDWTPAMTELAAALSEFASGHTASEAA